jgi:hypothetical protein
MEDLLSGAVPSTVIGKEAFNAVERLGHVIGLGQEHDAHMIVMRPVETGALHQQYFFLLFYKEP